MVKKKKQRINNKQVQKTAELLNRSNEREANMTVEQFMEWLDGKMVELSKTGEIKLDPNLEFYDISFTGFFERKLKEYLQPLGYNAYYCFDLENAPDVPEYHHVFMIYSFRYQEVEVLLVYTTKGRKLVDKAQAKTLFGRQQYDEVVRFLPIERIMGIEA